MSSITATLRNSHREPLNDISRILVYRHKDRRLAAQTTTTATSVEFVGLTEEVHHVRVFPEKHRACSSFVRAGGRVTVHCPVRPECVRRIEAPDLCELELTDMIQNHELDSEPLASALNIWSKLKHTKLGLLTAADYVERITLVLDDRLFFVPHQSMLDAVRQSTPAEFVAVSGALHAFPTYWVRASFKTRDLYGNLQLTFLENSKGEFLVDADIDEASGLLHCFHVIQHAITGKETHPYDIHEILTFYQELDTGYRLIV